MKKHIALIFTIYLCLCTNSYGEINKTLIDETIATAETTAIKLGYDVKKMGMMIKVNELPDYMYVENNEFVKSGSKYEILNQLKDKEYFSIYYKIIGNPPENGDICIIVDAKDGKTILNIYEGKKMTTNISPKDQ